MTPPRQHDNYPIYTSFELEMSNNITEMKADIKYIKDTIECESVYHKKVNKLEHDMIRLKTYGLTLAALSGGVLGRIADYLNIL